MLELIFRIQIFSLAAVLGMTISDLINLLLFHIFPSPVGLAISAVCWAATIKLNPAWTFFWEKWTTKK